MVEGELHRKRCQKRKTYVWAVCKKINIEIIKQTCAGFMGMFNKTFV
jgi:hypothetical protein